MRWTPTAPSMRVPRLMLMAPPPRATSPVTSAVAPEPGRVGADSAQLYPPLHPPAPPDLNHPLHRPIPRILVGYCLLAHRPLRPLLHRPSAR